MFKNIFIDRKYRFLYLQFEKLYIILKFIKYSDFFEYQDKLYAFFLLQLLPKNSSIVRLHKYCLLTGRSRGLITFVGVSRIKFRELILAGVLSNFKKIK